MGRLAFFEDCDSDDGCESFSRSLLFSSRTYLQAFVAAVIVVNFKYLTTQNENTRRCETCLAPLSGCMVSFSFSAFSSPRVPLSISYQKGGKGRPPWLV